MLIKILLGILIYIIGFLVSYLWLSPRYPKGEKHLAFIACLIWPLFIFALFGSHGE